MLIHIGNMSISNDNIEIKDIEQILAFSYVTTSDIFYNRKSKKKFNLVTNLLF